MKEFLTYRTPGPIFLPKGKGFGGPLDSPIVLPSWLSEEDVKYYTSKFEKKGFTGGLNFYRNLDLYVPLPIVTYKLMFLNIDCPSFAMIVHVSSFPYLFLFPCRNWELTAPWTGAQIKVPVKFIVGDQDLTYHFMGAKDFIGKGGFKKFVPLLQEVVVMEGVAHFINQEKADEINKHIYDFFQNF